MNKRIVLLFTGLLLMNPLLLRLDLNEDKNLLIETNLKEEKLKEDISLLSTKKQK